MKDFIEYLVKQIVSTPDAVTVEETQVGDFYVYTINADPADMGTIIGKKGRNINSIRNMARVKAIKDGVHIRVEVAEPEGGRVEAPAKPAVAEGKPVAEEAPTAEEDTTSENSVESEVDEMVAEMEAEEA
jgi:predicted RNA-binding protein YlqC (UPF0109 family)